MKLPGIQYRGVQSLGGPDIGAPMRVANARARAAAAWSGAAREFQRAANDMFRANAEAEYESATVTLANEEARLRALMSQRSIDTSEIPSWVDVKRTEAVEGPDKTVTEVDRGVIPTHEVADQLYRGAMERTAQVALANMSNPLAKREFQRKALELSGQGAADIYAVQLAYQREQNEAMWLAGVDEHIKRGREGAAKAALARGVLSGIIDPDTGRDMLADLETQIDEQRFYDELARADTESDYERLGLQVARSRMDAAAKRTAIQSLRAAENAAYTKREREDKEAAERVEADYWMQLTAGNTTRANAQRAAREAMRLGQADVATRILKSWDAAQVSGASDPEAVSDLQRAVLNVGFGDDLEEDARRARIAVNQALNAGTISYDDAKGLLGTVSRQASQPFNTEGYRSAEQALGLNIVGEDWLVIYQRFNQNGGRIRPQEAMQLAGQRGVFLAEALMDLRAYTRRTGQAANYDRWLTENLPKYTAENASKTRVERFVIRYPQYYQGDTDLEAVLRLIVNDETITVEEQTRRMLELQQLVP